MPFPRHTNRETVLEFLQERCSNDDLEQVCFYLNIRHQNLERKTLSEFARSLVDHCVSRRREQALVASIIRWRSDASIALEEIWQKQQSAKSRRPKPISKSLTLTPEIGPKIAIYLLMVFTCISLLLFDEVLAEEIESINRSKRNFTSIPFSMNHHIQFWTPVLLGGARWSAIPP